jgi:diguanylate cyclase
MNDVQFLCKRRVLTRFQDLRGMVSASLLYTIGKRRESMGVEIELSMRGPRAYALAREAITVMEAQQVWPTPLNFELWLHYVGDPDSALGQELTALMQSGGAITEQMTEELAARYLPKLRLNEEIRDAGDKMNKQLETITQAIKVAQRASSAYGKTLAGASVELAETHDQDRLQSLVQGLANATRKVQRENGSLERRLEASTTEIRTLREHLEQVRREAMTDALTSLANRKSFDEALERACAEAEANNTPLTLALIDIDHFKRFNDTWGHQTGDQVIRYVASVIGRVGAPPRLAARYGGEEFAIIFPKADICTVNEEMDAARSEIGSRSLKRRSTNEDLGAVTVSAGLAQRQPGETPLNFMERTDAALYASKRTGRNKISQAVGALDIVEAA